MRRLNVQFSQIEECIRTSLFAVEGLPRNPPLKPGEELLLQLVKEDAKGLGKLGSRVEFALLFERAIDDPTGELSRTHWPNAGKTWRYILHCSETVPTIPFSLENLGPVATMADRRTRCTSNPVTPPAFVLSSRVAWIRPSCRGSRRCRICC